VATRLRQRGLIATDAVAAPGWLGLAAAFAVLALLGMGLPAAPLDWQPSLAAQQPWRWWTPVLVHLSALHLAANVAGAAMVAWVGWAAAVPGRVALAWGVAWPLTHLGLWLRPELERYAGLSGVLHAGVACLGAYLVMQAWPRLWAQATRHRVARVDDAATRRSAWIGAAILAVLAAKVLMEKPWGPAARAVEGWDIAVAPIGHATGSVAGLLTMLVIEWVFRWRRRRAAS
jgi:membrane associated rhomboid family serine protease